MYFNLKSLGSLTLRGLADPTDGVCARELIDSYDWRSIFCGITHCNSCPSRCMCGCEVGFRARCVLTKFRYLQYHKSPDWLKVGLWLKASGPSSLLRTNTSSCAQHNVTSQPPPEILGLLMVNKWWSGVTYHRLYLSISMGNGPRLNVAGMLCCTLAEELQIAALFRELQMAEVSVVNCDIQDQIALLDLCINQKHVNILGYRLHNLEGCHQALVQRSLISIHIRMENLFFLKDLAFCSTGYLLEMMQGWPN